MKKFLIALFAVTALTAGAWADNYTINNDEIDQLFVGASELAAENFISAGFDAFSSINGTSATAQLTESKPNPWVAFVLCFFLGDFGIHRHYLGTSNAMFLIYMVTCCGIFGIVPFIDWIVLLVAGINDNCDAYINNNKFLMWL